MSKTIFFVSVTDEALKEKLEYSGLPIGYYVVGDSEVKARNVIRRYVQDGPDASSESEAYKKSSRMTDCVVIGTAVDGLAAGILTPVYGD